MDTNKYRAQYRYTQGEGALTDEEREKMIARYNKPDLRNCIGLECNKKFKSEGAHNRKCPKCKQKEDISRDRDITRNPILHRDPTLKTRRFAEFSY